VTADWITKMEVVGPVNRPLSRSNSLFGDFMWSMTSTYGNHDCQSNPGWTQHLGKLEDGSPDYGMYWLHDNGSRFGSIQHGIG